MANQGLRLPKLKLTINELLYLITIYIEILRQYYNNMANFIRSILQKPEPGLPFGPHSENESSSI